MPQLDFSMVPRRAIQIWATIASTLVLGSLLTATIYWTLFDPRWVAFLGGVVFAAILAMASQASKTQWALARRSRQLERTRAALAEQAAQGQIALEAFRSAELKLHALGDAIPCTVLFIDREERCRAFNRELQQWQASAEQVREGIALRDAIGEDAYAQVHAHLADAFGGVASSCDISAAAGPYTACRACLYPYPAGTKDPAGVLLLFEPKYAGGSRGDPASQGERDSGDLLYMRALTSEVMGWEEPRAKLAAALRDDQFLLMSQAIRPLAPGPSQPVCEILLRLREEEDNRLPPGGFLPVAEHYGMMEQLDRWVVRNVVSHGLELKGRGEAVPLFCVNLSAAAVASRGFMRFVQQQLHDRDFDPRSLCFEIAEPDIGALRDDLQRLIGALKGLGCRFTVDGFGAARASFAPLQGLAFDFVKIDGVIVQNILRNPGELAKARAIATVCRKSGMSSIAEFVEDDATLAKLREAGVDYVQGFGIARPCALRAAMMAVDLHQIAPLAKAA